MLPMPKLVEIGAYVLLFRDAQTGKVAGVSPQTCVALAVSASLSIFNLPTHRMWEQFFLVLLVAGMGWSCSYKVAKRSDANNEDDIILEDRRWPMPVWARRSVAYWSAAVMSAVAILVACKFSIFEVVRWSHELPTGILCTFQNFLHGTALLHQLFLSRRRSMVAPAAARFLLILGVKHMVELFVDLAVSYSHFLKGTLELHEASFMSGDIFAAAVLLDYLYIFATSRSKMVLPVCFRAAGLPLEVV